MAGLSLVPITGVRARAYRIPTDAPEADGTSAWTSTTLVVVEVDAGGTTGIGYTYADAGTAAVVSGALADAVRGREAMDVPGAWAAMERAVRNMGRSGLAATAISAVDIALWDLKARLLDLPLATLLGRVRDAVPIYGSGGFTTYDDAQMRDQLGGWTERDGCRAAKIKVGSDPANDPRRVAVAREAIGDGLALFVDANGALSVKAAIAFARTCADHGVSWFEEPVSSDDLPGLRAVRAHVLAPMEVAAGDCNVFWPMPAYRWRKQLRMPRPTIRTRSQRTRPRRSARESCLRPCTLGSGLT